MIREGNIVLTPLPQADGQVKNRPALVLRQLPPFNDWLVCGISTQLHQKVEEFDALIAAKDSDYESSGLRAPSIIRLGFLAMLPSAKILGSIGSISAERHGRLLQTLSRYLVQNIS